MVRSIVVKLVSSGAVASSTTWRSARADPAFHPNSVRSARMSQSSDDGRSTSPCCTGTGRLPDRGVSERSLSDLSARELDT